MTDKKELAEQILMKHIGEIDWPEFKEFGFLRKATAAIIEAMEQPPLCDDILDGMDRDDLEVAYRKLRDSNSIYCKAVMDKHNEILELRRQVEAMGVQPGMRWVKASEKPPHNKGVLVFIPEEDNHITSGMWDISNNWVLLDEYRPINNNAVTHWMPLPEPPEAIEPK